MDDETQVGSEDLETTETEEGEQAETAEETPEEKIARLEKEKAQLAAEKAETDKKNKQLFARVKKDEAAHAGLSPKDLLALSKADLHTEDLEELQDYASFKKISLADALQDPTMKAILATKQAERITAEATATRGARGATKPDGEDILRTFERTGEVPDTDEGMQALWAARVARNKVRK